MSRIIAIVLAAGRGERLGGPKALLAWPGEGGADIPLAIAHAEGRLAAESARVLVVTRAPIMNFLVAYVRPGIDLLASDAPDELGPAGSLGFAASRLDMSSFDVAIITPVDTPPARPETVQALLAALDERGASAGARDEAPVAARARHGRRAGHPVLLRPAALERYREPNPPPLREHLRAQGARCLDVDVDDPNVVLDIDRPNDVLAVLKAPARFLGAV